MNAKNNDYEWRKIEVRGKSISRPVWGYALFDLPKYRTVLIKSGVKMPEKRVSGKTKKPRSNMTLEMECVEEPLSEAQIKAKLKYQENVNKVKKFCTYISYACGILLLIRAF